MDNLFPILAVETTGELCSAAILLDEKNYIELNYLQKHIHSQKLIDIIDTVLVNAKVEINRVKSVAISMGPGSFTGLRIGLSAVKGIAFGANLPIIPVPTFDAFAYQLSQNLLDETEFVIAINASIDDFYFAKYKKQKDEIKIIENLRLVEKEHLPKYICEKDFVYGNINYKNILNSLTTPNAQYVGKWAYLFGNDLLTFNYDYLEPNYFKKFIAKVKS